MSKKYVSSLRSNATSEEVTDDFWRQSHAKDERNGVGTKGSGEM
jgi:hypothetical protein